jgi:hypothetical protein
MAWLSGYYKRPKNPWIGAVLVFVIGPFGFLYHSWKATLYLLVAFPLWFIFLRHTPFDLTNPVPHYLVLLSMAVFAWFQIKGQPSKRENDQAITFAKSLLATDYDRKVFAEFLRQHRELTAKVQDNQFFSDGHDDPWPRWTLGMLFSSYGAVLGDKGDLKEASKAFVFSMDFFDENPMAWAGLAELNILKQDKIAARYAKKILDFAPMASASELVQQVFSKTDALASLTQMKDRMRAIVQVCQEHPEWQDTYARERIHRPFRDPL